MYDALSVLRHEIEWVLTSPDLLDASATGVPSLVSLWPQWNPHYHETARAFSPLALDQFQRAFSVRGRKTLGHYFEDLLGLCLTSSLSDWSVRQGIQVYNGTTTIGEYDFILQKMQQAVHLEAAIKYYLYVPGDHDLESYYGPNAKDTLGKKWRKLRDQQLQLALPPSESASILWSRSLALKGMIAYPWRTKPPGHPLLASDHQTAWWLPATALNDATHEVWDGLDYLLPVPRLLWLAPLQEQTLEDLNALMAARSRPHHSFAGLAVTRESWLASPLAALLHCPASEPESLLVVRMQRVGARLREIDRGFLVSDAWREAVGHR